MVRASCKDATRSPPEGHVPGMSSWEEATGKTEEDQVEGLYLHSGLGTPRDPPVRAGRRGRQKGSLPDEDGWMDGLVVLS